MVSVRGGQFVIQVINTITILFTHLLEGVCIYTYLAVYFGLWICPPDYIFAHSKSYPS